MLDNIAFGIVISILFISLLVLFCILLIKLYINKIKNYTALIYQKDIDFQKTLNATIIETQEQALNNISRDLHDDAGQQLTYINFVVENLKLDNPELKDALQPVSQSIQSLSSSIRNISHSLNSQLLIKDSLVKAMEAEIERLKNYTGIAFSFNLNGSKKKAYGGNEKIVIYRIFQESIHNILKHSGASEVVIELTTEPYFKMVISDNGKGFDPQLAKSGIGLENMAKRAEIINFKVSVASRAANGTIITLSEK